jgi:phosphinothricin acetyltransferase
MSDVTIRPAQPDDLCAINDIYNHYVATCTCTYQTEPEPMEARMAWFKAHDHAHPILVAELDGVVVGWGSLSFFLGRAAYRFTVENSVYVRHDMLRRGIGSAMLRRLIDEARANGFHSILASISADRTASVALHEKFGFRQVACLKEVGYKFNQWLDVVYLQLML